LNALGKSSARPGNDTQERRVNWIGRPPDQIPYDVVGVNPIAGLMSRNIEVVTGEPGAVSIASGTNPPSACVLLSMNLASAEA
jgi:hypothetical protein